MRNILFGIIVFGISWGTLSVQAKDPDGLEIIDAHTHTFFSGKAERSSGLPMTEAEYFKEMKEAGVTGAVAHTRPGNVARGLGAEEDGYVDLRAKNIVHCFGLEAKVDESRLEEGLKSGKYGCIKVYLGYIHQFAYDEKYTPAYKLAEKYKVPVVFHTGDTYSTEAMLKFAHPLTIDEVAVKFPKVNFVIAHCGNPWTKSAAEVAYKNPNVFLDVSAFLVGDLKKLPKQKVETYVVGPIKWIFGYLEDPTKLMFGTDWPLTEMKTYVAVVKQAIPKKHWKAVFHDNAARVFKLK